MTVGGAFYGYIIGNISSIVTATDANSHAELMANIVKSDSVEQAQRPAAPVGTAQRPIAPGPGGAPRRGPAPNQRRQQTPPGRPRACLGLAECCYGGFFLFSASRS